MPGDSECKGVLPWCPFCLRVREHGVCSARRQENVNLLAGVVVDKKNKGLHPSVRRHPEVMILLLLPSTKLVSTFDLLELSNCDKLCKQGFHFFLAIVVFSTKWCLASQRRRCRRDGDHHDSRGSSWRDGDWQKTDAACDAQEEVPRSHALFLEGPEKLQWPRTHLQQNADRQERAWLRKGAALCTVAWDEVQVETCEDTGT